MSTFKCAHCGKTLQSNPRVKHQRYCSDKACQRERRRLWQRQKLVLDSEYRDNQKDCQKQWRQRHPDYWRKWRQSHDAYVQNNRLRSRARQFAKMDTLNPKPDSISGCYFILPGDCEASMFAKMDALPQKIVIIPVGCTNSDVLQNRTRSTG